MGQLYFHCSHPKGTLIDRCGAAIADLNEAHDHATGVVRSFLMKLSPEDWRSWVLHVCDDRGDDVFLMPFSFVLGKPH
ncbi:MULTISPECIES: hypothetical protein [Bradyrhizobium]|uniref:DUF6894 family protein n=1 Tax=Bradyrhizobium TaxID=374 RepID=UPI00067EF5CB|nr:MULTISPECIES: hypothetical protein [Bradyrhizobium]PAY06514.1 hypothetical protein CK489_26900 [Bradyrhizobium sp. UFLA03-84]PDT77399.1 hypothetical protein CO675_12800 [Bradyrhizobium sp. C9]